MSDTFLVAGLGNPGADYALTRHNVGFMVADCLAEKYDTEFQAGRGDYIYAPLRINASTVYVVKPLTYMNLSGRAVHQAVEAWKIPISNLLIVYDDYHLPFGKIRLRPGGSDGGHKGMRSVIYTLERDDIPRLRVGIGHEDFDGDAVKFVLSQFSRKEKKLLPTVLDLCCSAIETFILRGIETAMNRFNHQFITHKEED